MTKRQRDKETKRQSGEAIFRRIVASSLCLIVIFLFSCSQLEKPKTEPFYAETAPPQKKEFRWSNGKMPKSFDPALASAPPDTDVVRAVYEGLTDTDSNTLGTVPAIATEWKSSDDFKTWTFNLRKTARWSNGERVTAKDFVRSWRRVAEMGDKVPHRELLKNIVGIDAPATNIVAATPENANVNSANQNSSAPVSETNSNVANVANSANTNSEPKIEFGAEAADNFTLVVSLVKPDKDFPVLVAHPIFRPVHGDGNEFKSNELNASVVTNGAFRISSVGQDGITLDRAENYWNKDAVELERVRFVPTENAEKALAAYRAGEVDAVTNAAFEPLALKLLTPFEDFRRTTHSAINFYEFNRRKPPFDDRRVREALAISIERERLTEDEMDGASLPAFRFLPSEMTGETKQIVQNTQKAKTLLAESGYPNGENFPAVKLVINRNNVQQRIARSVARMWKRSLNIETEIVVKESAQFDAARTSEDFDLIRRGVVLPTNDETANMMAIFASPAKPSIETAAQSAQEIILQDQNLNLDLPVSTPELPNAETITPPIDENLATEAVEDEAILTEEQALSELPAIPLYFPTSYSLVKPYVQGFTINILDAPSLKDVRIDNNWQPKNAAGKQQ